MKLQHAQHLNAEAFKALTLKYESNYLLQAKHGFRAWWSAGVSVLPCLVQRPIPGSCNDKVRQSLLNSQICKVDVI